MTELQTQIAVELWGLWERVPHMRLCQLISDIAGPGLDYYYMSDEAFLRKLRDFVKVVDARDKAIGTSDTRPIIDQSTLEEVKRYEEN